MAGAVLCTLNIRHDSTMVAVLLKHSEAKVLIVDYQFLHIAQGALKILSETSSKLPHLILIPDYNQEVPTSSKTSSTFANLDYDGILQMGSLDFEIRRPEDEWEPIYMLSSSFAST
ncbi:putative acyl-CoA synthetase YngI-like protein [Corchorus capsularis]|uniref:Putative acyl-CoA synthetase YngI-like protein n=1 Tax=Corchorus capsularis TaxID=210143 RepID=A0A1R3IV05_COCAP|nr:putative acyl-CoA synthetase YngI-like protein [Corchorus capsularis]